jgi:hypothetical protein
LSLAVQLRRLIGGKGPWRGARGGRGAVAQLPGKRLGKGIGRQLSDARVRPHGVVVAVALGHEVRLMPPAYVKPYVKRNKTDAADAEAIAEAVTRPTMRFVAVKSADNQAALMLHRVREMLVRQRTMLATGLRAHLAEFGIVAPQGIRRVEKLAAAVHSAAVPPMAREALMLLVDENRHPRGQAYGASSFG